MTHITGIYPFALAVLFLGLGSCATQIPETVSPESVASCDPPESCDPALAGRLQNCSPGTADCDRNPENECEAVLADDPENCGVCGVQCTTPNANAGCMGGTCRIISCAPGYRDADGEPENGCETAAKPDLVPPSQHAAQVSFR